MNNMEDVKVLDSKLYISIHIVPNYDDSKASVVHIKYGESRKPLIEDLINSCNKCNIEISYDKSSDYNLSLHSTMDNFYSLEDYKNNNIITKGVLMAVKDVDKNKKDM